MTLSYTVFMLTFALVFYVLGATFLEGFVNYRTWHLIGPGEFKTYHRALRPRIFAFVVFPIILTLVCTVILLWLRPPPIPPWGIWCSLALNLIAIAVSIAFQIPIQLEFDRNGLSAPLLRRLISIEWFRHAAHLGNSLLFLWMMVKVLLTT